MITELCRGGLPRIAKNRIGRKIGGATRAEARVCGLSHQGQEPGSRPTPAIRRCRPRAGWGCDAAGALEPAAAERPAVHFTI
jgi:hypothetical protein